MSEECLPSVTQEEVRESLLFLPAQERGTHRLHSREAQDAPAGPRQVKATRQNAWRRASDVRTLGLRCLYAVSAQTDGRTGTGECRSCSPRKMVARQPGGKDRPL
jgi:hypothetical protein